MNVRKPAALAALAACAVLALTACDPEDGGTAAPVAPAASTTPSTPAAPPAATPSGGTGGSTATPAGKTGAAGATVAADVPICGNSEQESDVKAELTLDRSANPRINGVIELTNTSGHDCVVYGGPDLRTNHVPDTFMKLRSGVLGGGSFATDRAHGTVLHPGTPVYQAVSWLASPPVAANATCTTGDVLELVRNGEVLGLTMRVEDGRYCPIAEDGSDQIQLGVPKASEAEARAQWKHDAK
ncbi:hypothetical protein K353_05653 [Kitasatospora sp. SolWspMP-SS2h]|uniref:hypothetical protein n=1 Tax=Kitasatospora sp. SolWspMP-SS2h TaxID=1305729 RepID=UPI000DB97488|nr:hypothetical protein [Kitasatospora sp. SolWspMP-SS2h]RAJ33257.1 hypothetical protein K353_05653 [Kitasatospora sp. SolWspMP-SS2h]